MTEPAAATDPVHIDLAQLLRDSWAVFAKQPGVHVLAFLIVAVGGSLTLGIAAPALLVGYLRMIERMRAGERVQLGDILEGMSAFTRALLAGFITAVAVAIGLALVVLPGVVVAVVWSYALWFVALDGKSGLDALASSWQIARHQTGPLLLILLTVVALNFLGGLVVFGTVLTGPFAIILMTCGFSELRRA